MSVAPALIALAALASSPDLGKAEGRCAPSETRPSFLVDVLGLRDRVGLIKVEVYPADDQDFLEDDNILLSAGKTFRRVETPLPLQGPVEICVRVPRAGPYAVSVLHDRVGNHKFNASADGIGFSANPRLGLSKPKASTVTTQAQDGPTRIGVTMNYRRSLFSFGPLETH